MFNFKVKNYLSSIRIKQYEDIHNFLNENFKSISARFIVRNFIEDSYDVCEGNSLYILNVYYIVPTIDEISLYEKGFVFDSLYAEPIKYNFYDRRDGRFINIEEILLKKDCDSIHKIFFNIDYFLNMKYYSYGFPYLSV